MNHFNWTMKNQSPVGEESKDLGFGAKVVQQSRSRFLNRDGSFNVVRHGLSVFDSLSPYHSLLTMAWGNFFLAFGLFYLAANVLFAFAYLSCGRGALQGASALSGAERFLEAFFFSVQTFTTIGYG